MTRRLLLSTLAAALTFAAPAPAAAAPDQTIASTYSQTTSWVAMMSTLEHLQVGDSVIAEIHRERAFVEQDGRTVKGDRCVKMPDVTNGYGECAITEYQVTFTRMS